MKEKKVILTIGEPVLPEPNPTNEYHLVAETSYDDGEFFSRYTLTFSSLSDTEVENLKKVIQTYEWLLSLDSDEAMGYSPIHCPIFQDQQNFPDFYHIFEEWPCYWGDPYQLLSYQLYYYDEWGRQYKIVIEVQ